MAKVLLLAPTCDRDDVGEAWVAYQWARSLADHHDLTLVTYHKRGRQPASEQLSGLRVIEWAEPPGIGRFERLNSMLKPGYLPFYLRSRRWIRDSLKGGEKFDVAHQVTPVATRYPSPAAGLGIPLIIGPVGGGLDDPPGFATQDTAPWYVSLRRIDRTRFRIDPLLRHSYSSAACVLGIAPYVADHLNGIPLRRFEVMSETGLAEMPAFEPRMAHDGQIRLLFVGRLIRTKGARDAIAAMDQLRDLEVSLDVVGDGFDRAACEELASRYGLGDRVRFHGQRTHDEVADFYRVADVFVFPSYREPGGNVIFEAMGWSLPLVVCARGGPAQVVDDTCGFRLATKNPEQLAHDIAQAIRALVRDPELRLRMGRAARDRVKLVGLWSAKVSATDRLYDEVIAGCAPTRAAEGC